MLTKRIIILLVINLLLSFELLTQPKFIDLPHDFYLNNNAMHVDNNGYLHITYGGSMLYYATNKSGKWEVSVPDSSSGYGATAVLALDKLGSPHIVYRTTINSRFFL